jgi:hypothetical protein
MAVTVPPSMEAIGSLAALRFIALVGAEAVDSVASGAI